MHYSDNQMESDDFTLEKWYERNPKFRKANADFIARRMKLEWSVDAAKIKTTEDKPSFPSAKLFYCKFGEKEHISKNDKKKTTAKGPKQMVNIWTAARKERQEVRRQIIAHLIDHETSAEIQSSTEDKIRLQYRYYIEFGSDVSNVGKMDKHVVQHILRITPNNDRWPMLTKELMTEVETEYGLAIQKSIVDFALKDLSASRPPVEHIYFSIYNMFNTDHQRKAYIKLYKENQENLKKNLYSINLCISHMSKIWQKQYTHMSIINIDELTKRSEPFDLMAFLKAINQHIDNTRNILNKNWYESLRDTFIRGKKRKDVPHVYHAKQLARFFNCIAALMTRNLADLCIKSLHEFTDFVCNDDSSKNLLRLHVLLANVNKIVFNPSFQEIDKQFLRIIDKLVDFVQQFSRLESKIYLDNINTRMNNLNPYITDDIIDSCKQRIRDFLIMQNQMPTESVKDFIQFESLINSKSIDDINLFMIENPNFEDSQKLVYDYKEIEDQIHKNLWLVKIMGFYEFHRENFIEQLAILARFMQTEVLAKMIQRQQKDVMNLQMEYDVIFQRILSLPNSTAELMELIQALNDSIETTLPEMEQKIRTNAEQFLWLMQNEIYTPVQRKQNIVAIQLYLDVPSILDSSRLLIEDKGIEFKEKLAIRIQRLNSDLSSYSDEMQQV